MMRAACIFVLTMATAVGQAPPPAAPAQTPPPQPAPAQPAPAQPEPAPRAVVNFNNQPLLDVINALARDLHINYILDATVKAGTVTMNTYGAGQGVELRPLFETILRMNNLAMVQAGDIYRIVPIQNIGHQPISPVTQNDPSKVSDDERLVLNLVFPGNTQTSGEMAKVLLPFIGDGGQLNSYDPGNLLVILDNSRNMKRTLELISQFDSETFAGQRVRAFEVKNGRPSDIAKDLTEVFKAYSLSNGREHGAVQFIGIDRVSTILAIAPNPGAFTEVERWLAKFDIIPKTAAGGLQNYVYKLKYGQCGRFLVRWDLTVVWRLRRFRRLWKRVWNSGKLVRFRPTGYVGALPGCGAVAVRRYGGARLMAVLPYGGGGGGAIRVWLTVTSGGGYGNGGYGGGGAGYGGGGGYSGGTNPNCYWSRRIRSGLPGSAGKQRAGRVLRRHRLLRLAARRAGHREQPQYTIWPGPIRPVRIFDWFGFGSCARPGSAAHRTESFGQYPDCAGHAGAMGVDPQPARSDRCLAPPGPHRREDLRSGSDRQLFRRRRGLPAAKGSDERGGHYFTSAPGFEQRGFLLSTPLPSSGGTLVGQSRQLLALLQLTESKTRAKVLSAPSVIATDSIPASITVGDSVPTLTSQAVNAGVTSGGNSLFTQTISNTSSGIGLNILARVNASGIVTMVINQNVTAPEPNPTGTSIDSPSFSQRNVSTQVTVQDGDTIAIGGIINESTTESTSGIPLLDRLPYIGAAFGNKSYTKQRTELIIFLTPRVIYDTNQIQDATQELKERMKGLQKVMRNQ